MLVRIIILSLLLSLSTILNAQIRVASGLESEIYTQFAKDIQNNSYIDLDIETTAGSAENLKLLINGDVDLAFVQYDGLIFEELNNPGIQEKIKIFLPLYYEEIHLISNRSSDINNIQDLQNKTVGVGDANSGTFITSELLKQKLNINCNAVNISFEESMKFLVNDSIDAFFYVGAAPSNLLKNLSESQSSLIKLVNISSNDLNKIYENKSIDKSIYPWMTNDIETFSVRSLLAVNTSNLDTKTEQKIDSLYNDLKANLKGIQKNKFSHEKWDQVDFTDTSGLSWAIYKKKYVTPELIIDIMAIIAAILTFLQIYLMINKLWKRKHERVVAESVSISAMFISITINGFFAIKNLGSSQVPQLAANILWITGSVISAIIGIGLWVSTNKGIGFWKLLRAALNLERKEAGDLAKMFFRPSSAEEIIEILGRMAMIDEDLDAREKDFIQDFADNWSIKLDWEKIKKYKDEDGDPYRKIKKSMHDLINSNPPEDQVSQLRDVLSILVNIDDVVTTEEELMMAELNGIISKYLSDDSDPDVFKVAVVPRNEEQEKIIENKFKELQKQEVAGGFAYVSDEFYSETYAEIISAQYRTINVFSVVFKPNHMLSVDEIKIKGGNK